MATRTEKIIVTDNLTGERELIGDELTEFLAFRDAYLVNLATQEAEAATKAAQRQALLTRLGITEDEARLLLG